MAAPLASTAAANPSPVGSPDGPPDGPLDGPCREPPDGPLLVCGLGQLGQAVLKRLLPFDSPLICLDLHPPDWQDPQLLQRFAGSEVIGDMRRPHVLRQAGIGQARAVLLLSSDSSVNFEAALQVRLLNPRAEIVVRSSSDLDHLGSLLEQRLPGVAVVDPLQMMAGALTQALRPGQQLARFEVDGQAFLVLEAAWQDRRLQRPLRLPAPGRPLLVAPAAFHGPHHLRLGSGLSPWSPWPPLQRRAAALKLWYRQRSRLQWSLLLGVLTMLLLGVAGFSRQVGWWRGTFVTLALLKGEYVDPVNVVLGAGTANAQAAGQGWLIAGGMAYSLVGTLLTSALVAVILDRLLSVRFGLRRRGAIRRNAEPILLVEGGTLARRVAEALRREGHTLVRVESQSSSTSVDGRIPVFERLEEALQALGRRPLLAAGLLSGDLLADLRGVLQLQAVWPQARLAMLARQEAAAEQLGELLGGVALVSPIELGADVVVATAFGERVEGVWRLGGSNVLQVRYRLETGDTLCGLTVARLENGYGVTAISLRRQRRAAALALPPPELVLAPGDQLVVLATLAALRRIERSELAPPAWQLRLRLPESLGRERHFELLQTLARYLGCAPAAMAPLLAEGTETELAVDPECGELLLRDLRCLRLQVSLSRST